MTDDEWRDLFDGESLDGWETTGDGAGDNWTVEDGVIACRGTGGGYLHTEEQFGDFDLSLEFNIDPGVNSGVFFRLSDLSNPVHTGLEFQILDTPDVEDPDAYDCGALYDLVAPEEMAFTGAGEWNDVRITCEGPTVRAAMNDRRVFDVDLSRWTTPGENPDGTANKFDYAWADLPQRGHVALQDHGGRALFRDVRVRER